MRSAKRVEKRTGYVAMAGTVGSQDRLVWELVGHGRDKVLGPHLSGGPLPTQEIA